MKNLLALLLVVSLGWLVFNQVGTLLNYGEVDIENRDSNAYIHKNVTEETKEVVFKESEDLETGSANIVTSIIVNYRSMDTLGEVTVLFISALGVSLLLGGTKRRIKIKRKPSFILKHGARVAFGIMVVNGVSMIIHGHLTPGGGFPGGSILAAAVLLLYAADDSFRVKLEQLKVAEGLVGSIYVLIGIAGIAITGYFLGNFLPTGVVGDVISAGIIPIVYLVIGLKVGLELSGIVENFLSEEVVE